MPIPLQAELFPGAEPPVAAITLFCHQEFLEKLAEHNKDNIGKRAAFLLQRLSVDARRLHYKPTQGVNRGWRRSRLGGNFGSHFYAWWAPSGAVPLRESGEFDSLPDGAIVLRDIRHHDDHSPLQAQSFQSHYMPITVQDLRSEEYSPLPYTQPQARFASARQTVRLLKGHPGSGKTTALWHAADMASAERVLYVTYSRDLANLARDYFQRFCSPQKHFQVITFPTLVRQLLGQDPPAEPDFEIRKRFAQDLAPFARSLGAWTGHIPALYDELHAHVIGDALPIAIGRFAACKHARVLDKFYLERRARFIGQGPATTSVELAARLDRAAPGQLAERYFPELALAWQAVQRLHTFGGGPELDAFTGFDCIAIDECQDLTPIESLVLIDLAVRTNQRRKSSIPFLLAGDEAQTVRPTDFEWGWLSDLLHARIGTPTEFKLTANLRSPRRIAELINHVWDLYGQLQKQDRPSGTGYAAIEDDAPDQIIYCAAAPGPELQELLIALAAREGLALITLEDTVPAYVPESVRGAVLTVREAKGLDFHSICVLDAGRHVNRILEGVSAHRVSEVDDLRRRLSIDQLRVVLSRPTERLFWLDVNPTDAVVSRSINFLGGTKVEAGIAPSVPAAILKALEEDELEPEERIQRCQADARQFLEIKPELALSRASQAITLLGRSGTINSVTDPAARAAAFLTLAEINFLLALRNVRLAPELGKPDLFLDAQNAADGAGRPGLASIIQDVASVFRSSAAARLQPLVRLAQGLPPRKKDIEPWLMQELESKSNGWADELEAAIHYSTSNASGLMRILPAFYEAIHLPDRDVRLPRIRQRSIQLLIKEKQFRDALEVLLTLPERDRKLEASCHENLGDFRAAAECHIELGNLKEALQCYRSIPDLRQAMKLLGQLGDHPAAESLHWIVKLEKLIEQRPEKFPKVVTAAEKQMLETLLVQALGVTRPKRAPAKTAKKAAKKAAKKPPAPKKQVKRRGRAEESPYF